MFSALTDLVLFPILHFVCFYNPHGVNCYAVPSRYFLATLGNLCLVVGVNAIDPGAADDKVFTR